MVLGFNDVRKGKLVVLDGEPFQVISHQFSRKQQRRPVMKTSLRHLGTGATREHTFMQSDKIEEADVDRNKMQFLYSEGGKLVFMDQENFEQVEIDESMAGKLAKFLLEGQEAEVLLFEGKPVSLDLPIKIERRVIEAPEGVKGNTSSNVMKDVVIEGNVKVRAPLFIKDGDMIKIDTRTGEYAERV